jgi:tetratricopeptide (TPR) repeat protein
MRPEYAPALDGLARVKEAQDDNTEAIAAFRRAIGSNKGYAPAYTHLGDLYLRMNRFEEAVMLLEEAVAVRPDYTPGLNRLALAYGRLRLDNEAVATIQAAIELDPKNAAHPATLGELQLTQGFVPAAEASFREALELDPALPEARLGLAKVSRRRGEYAAALEQIQIALDDERTGARMVSKLEQYRDTLRVEETEVARLETLVAETEEPPSEELEALAMIHARRGRWNDAAELALRAEPTPERHEKLAYMLFRAGRFAEAHEIYSELVGQLQSADLEVNNGVTLAMLGDDQGAVEAYRRAVELEPENDGAELYLGNALLRLGDQPAAVAAYKSFLDRTDRGESAERVRRILRQIAPDALPPPPDASQPGAPRVDPDAEAKGDPS